MLLKGLRIRISKGCSFTPLHGKLLVTKTDGGMQGWKNKRNVRNEYIITTDIPRIYLEVQTLMSLDFGLSY